MVKTKLSSSEENPSSGNNKKITLQTRKEAKEKLRQEVSNKVEKKYDFLRNLENKEASEISDEDIAQFKKEGSIDEFDPSLVKELLEKKGNLSQELGSIKNEKIKLENTLKRAEHYKNLLAMKKNPLKIFGRKKIQKHIDTFGKKNGMNDANLDEYTVTNTIQQFPSKINPITKRENDLLQKLYEINRKIGAYTEINGGLYKISEGGLELLPERQIIKGYLAIRNHELLQDNSENISNNLVMNIFKLTRGKSPEDTESTIKEYLAVRNHELLKDDSEYIAYSRDADMNSLTFNIYKIVQGKSPDDIEKIIKEYFTIRQHELLKDNSENISYTKNADMNNITFNIFRLTQGKAPEETEKIIKEYLYIRNHELLQSRSGNIYYPHTSDLNTLSFRLFSMTKGKSHKDIEKAINEYLSIRNHELLESKSGNIYYSYRTSDLNTLALNIFSNTQGKSPEEVKKTIKEYLAIRNHTLLDDNKNIQFSDISDCNNLAFRLFTLAKGKSPEETEKIIKEYLYIRNHKLLNNQSKNISYSNTDLNNVALSLFEILKKRKVSNKDINQSITELSDSYQGYLTSNNLTSDAMLFNIFIDLLVDGKLDMPFMRGGNMMLGVMLDLMSNSDTTYGVDNLIDTTDNAASDISDTLENQDPDNNDNEPDSSDNNTDNNNEPDPVDTDNDAGNNEPDPIDIDNDAGGASDIGSDGF